ncbi:L-sorbose 1-dehydrogenase-like isoform X2 [Varroa destructor]|uniref:Glucose-methanol-choline oxidoreductase N-terminal domain-containing protein n=1 Tax=Varroa destructor TaxID=109461 RepID=A0A7M7KJT0_VARDE|nr:L-sorbose 1-dehydrogenase-like isoform X2 [Varroa destructor]
MTRTQMKKIFVSCLSALTTICDAVNRPSWAISSHQLSTCYDFIIVGAGSAGCRLAEKLSAIQDVKVLLLEAGGAPPDFTAIPLLTRLSFEGDWVQRYRVEPMKNAFITKPNQPQSIVTGRVLGGGSSINLMNYERGSLRDYDTWDKDYGARGWNGEEMFKYFRFDENNHDYELSDETHGRKGNLQVTSSYDTNILRGFFGASSQMGYSVRDINDGNVEGVYRMQATIGPDGHRSSAFTAFIQPHLGSRKNLHVAIGAFVTKIIFQKTSDPNVTTAHGVEFVMDGKHHKICTLKEIVLSAGAIESPRLLMLSGVGPKQHLEDMQIDVVSDLPVGQNLQNHVAVRGIDGAINATTFLEIPSVNDIKALMDWYKFGKGPFTSPYGTHLGVGFYKMNESDSTPDIEIMLQGLRDDAPPCTFQDNKGGPANFNLLTILMRPKSRGTVRLRNKDARVPPIIDLNYFDNADDIEILAREAFARVGVSYAATPIDACKDKDASSLNYWRCVVTVNTASMGHPVGTCRMGAKNRSDTVVDHKLRVKGVKGLRVADASVMPELNTGHTNAPAIAIGAKAGDLILKQHGLVS